MGAITLSGFEPHGLASQIADQWSVWESSRTVQKKRIAEVIQYVYATSTTETGNASLPWSHTTHIPKLTQIHDNLGANYASALFQGKWFAFEPSAEADQNAAKRRKIEAYIATKHDYTNIVLELKACLQDWVQTGNCFAQLEYVTEQARDPDTGTLQVVYEGPRLRRISPYDIGFDFTAKDFYRTAKIIRKLVSLADILITWEDEGTIRGWDASVVQKVRDMRNSLVGVKSEDVNKAIQRQFDGFTDATAYYRSGAVEVLEFYGDIVDNRTGELHRGCKIEVIDRRWVLSNTKINTLNGRAMIFHSGWRKRPDNLWAQGPLDNLIGMQYMIDHLENSKADAFDKMITPDRVIVGQANVTEDNGVTTYYIDDANGSVTNLGPDATVLNADLQIQIKEAQMEAYAGAPREAMGIRTPGEKTKFEVQQLQNAATRLFQHRLEEFESEFVQPVLQGELEISFRNLNDSSVARTFNDETTLYEFLTVTKDDLRTDGTLRARGASHYAQKSILVQEMAQFQNILMQDQELAVHFPAAKRAQVFEQALGLEQYGLRVPFGGVAEAVEREQVTAAGQITAAEGDAAAELTAGAPQL